MSRKRVPLLHGVGTWEGMTIAEHRRPGQILHYAAASIRTMPAVATVLVVRRTGGRVVVVLHPVGETQRAHRDKTVASAGWLTAPFRLGPAVLEQPYSGE